MPQMSLSERIFGSNGPTLKVSDKLQSSQRELVVSGELKGGNTFDAIGGRLDFGGKARAELRLLPGDINLGPVALGETSERLAPLGTFSPPAGKRWAELQILGGANVSASASSAGSVSLKIAAKAGLDFEYRGVRAVAATDAPEKAARDLLKTALLPFSRGLHSFQQNQWHELTFGASFGFSAEVGAGKTLTLESDSGPLKGLLPRDSPEVVAQIKILARAALGLELIDGLRVGCGQLPATRPDWVRYRLERNSQRKVSLGASLALELMYNRKILKRIYSVALDHVGYSQIETRLEEIANAIDPADLTFEKLKTQLSTELFDLATEVLPIDKATGQIAEKAKGLLDLIGKIKTRYAELDGEFQGLVDHFLGSSALGKGQELRKALEKLQALGQKEPRELVDDFVKGKLGELEPLIELLAEHSVDHLLLAGAGTLKQQIKRLGGGVTKFLALIDEVDASNLRDVLEKATGASTIQRVLDFINNAPDNLTDFRALLQAEADERLKSLIEKLAGRGINKISKKRLKRLREWARTVDDALGAAVSIDERLSAEIDELTDRVGFVASFSFDRITRSTVILDVELDPRVKACCDAFQSLSTGNLEEFTDRLPFERDPDKEDEEAVDPPFLFHHFVLASDRSTQLSWVFAPSIGGGSKRTRKAFDSSRIEIRQTPSTQRTATYSGGLVLATGAGKEGLLRSWMGSIWLESEASGPGPSLTDPYTEVHHRIRLATQRYDDDLEEATIVSRRTSLDLMLESLGFEGDAVTSRVPIEATAMKIAAEIVLTSGHTPDPVTRFLASFNQSKAQLRKSPMLDEAFLAAAREFLSDPLVRSTWRSKPVENEVLSAIVGSNVYRQRWRSGDWSDPFVVNFGAKKLEVRAKPPLDGARSAPILRSLALSRGWASGPLSRLGLSWDKIQKTPGTAAPEDLEKLTRAFRHAVRVSTPTLAFWDSPLFQHRLVFARLRGEVGEDGFPTLGVASIRWRLGEQNWQPTQRILM